MLDDQGYVTNLDPSNALGIIAAQPAQLRLKLTFSSFELDIDNIVVTGMGGSALGAEFIRSYLSDRLPVPLSIVRDYTLPAFVGPKTLLIASSYSGNTEETITALAQAKQVKAKIVVQSSGGKLAEIAQAEGYPHILFPGGFQPRLAVLFQVRALAVIFESAGLVSGILEELEMAANWVEGKIGKWVLESPESDNPAKQLAEHLVGKTIVVYGGPTLWLPTMKWKIDFNENSKNVASFYHLPEFSHNEYTGWLFPNTKNIGVIELMSNLDVPHISRRFRISNRLLSGKMPKPFIVSAEGETKLQQMLWTVLLGDFVSAYLAFLNGIDPTPVNLVESLKKELAKEDS
ncbi:MAG: bifunctional phosphoglucose/phosphomannose isomerase [Candidatus Saccharimonadia bacterium]